MKIFELSRKNGFRELNHVRYRLEIGKGAYSSGRLEQGMVDAICERLKDFRNMMLEFGVTEYRACSTSAFANGKSCDHSGTDLSENRNPGGDIKQCGAAFSGVQIHCGH